jgi:DNA-binding response OmpR family regulator
VHLNVVLLSTSRDRIETVRAASKRKGLECTVAPDESHAAAAMHGGNPGIYVIDAESLGDLNHVLHNRLPGWPVLVLATQFDSSAWVEMFKAGASEVIGDPLHAHKVDAAFDAFIRQPSPVPQARTIWTALARRFGFGADAQVR